MSARRRLAAAVVAALAASASAFADVDLSGVAARAESAADDVSIPRAKRQRYAALARRLAAPGAPGLRDDFAKLGSAAALSAGPLAGDAALADAVRAAITSGVSALLTECDAADEAASKVEPGRGRLRVDRLVAKGHADRDTAMTASSEGRLARACSVARRAADRLARASKLADRIVREQMERDPAWRTVYDGLGGTLLSVWAEPGLVPRVYAVGAHDAQGPTFVRTTQYGWERLDVAGAADLWWATGVPGDGVWTSGSGGAVFRLDPGTSALTDRATGVDATLYGVWGSGPADVWAVGGDLEGAAPSPALLHWDGDDWTTVPHPPAIDGRTLFKVWGAASDDVWACGQMGTLIHWDGGAWSVVDSGTPSTLLTVHGWPRTTAVGGPGVDAVVVERGEDGVWTPAPLPVATESLNGVFVPAAGDAWTVGYYGAILRRTVFGWTPVKDAPRTAGRHHHAVHVYDAELEALRADGHLSRLDLAFSRDQADKIYVQNRMLENGAELWSWLENGAHFYVCGDASRMAKDVDAALHQICESAGGLSKDAAAEYVAKLKAEKRYQRDVY